MYINMSRIMIIKYTFIPIQLLLMFYTVCTYAFILIFLKYLHAGQHIMFFISKYFYHIFSKNMDILLDNGSVLNNFSTFNINTIINFINWPNNVICNSSSLQYSFLSKVSYFNPLPGVLNLLNLWNIFTTFLYYNINVFY